MVLLFDAANTLIYKPGLFVKAKEVFDAVGINTSLEILRERHKLVSELIIFPDKTDKAFYNNFNAEWLYALGVIPTNQLLDSLFEACSYLPWEKFEDTAVLSELNIGKAILSNFHGKLDNLISDLFPNLFDTIIISEKEQVRKPDIRFYERAVALLGVNPDEIIYIGDSLKLDIEPALKVGMKTYLIDRNNDYASFNARIRSLYDLKQII